MLNTLKKINGFLSGIPATIVAGLFLLLDLIPHTMAEFGLAEEGFHFIPFEFSWITVVISGLPLLYSAIRKLIVNKGIAKISSALLITVAMLAAIYIGDLFAAGEVAFIMALGGILEDMTTDRAKKGLKKLIYLAPTVGRIIKEGKELSVNAEYIAVGDILRVLPGEKIPVDGIIIGGETSIDQSVMTGESIPADKAVGDSVFCGTLNRFGTIDIRATKVGEDSSLQKLIRMVKEAEDKKAPMARIADKWASLLVPVALIIAIIAGVVTEDIVRAVTVLVVFCPCALVLATPTAIMAAIGQATKQGVIIKSGEALEKMGRVDTVAFDKTGTLTKGELAVSDIIAFSGSETRLLTLAASAESKSEHPIAKAIVAFAREKELPLAEPNAFKMQSGRGIYARVGERALLCGNEKYLEESGVSLGERALFTLSELRLQGKATVIIASEGEALGVIALSDTLREESEAIVERLKAMQVSALLLTGDNQKTAEYFAKNVGIEQVYSELLPEEKVQNIEKLQAQGKTVAMIGDGVNDAPALKSASVGIAMGGLGSDIAVEAADIALMSDDISKLPYLKRLSLAAVRTIKFSISLSMLINIAAVVLSVLGLLDPTTGALVHNAGSCFVVLIAALLYDRKFK